MSTTLVDVSNALASAVETAGRAVVAIKEGGSRGVSGTIWAPGIAVASEHTIRGLEEVTISLPSSELVHSTIVGRDPGSDLAVLKFKQEGTLPAELADESKARVGHLVLAIGRREDGLNASYGVISAIGGPWRTWQGSRVEHYFRLDLLPFTGFSGGPLIDVQGRVLGINTSGPRWSILTIPTSRVSRVVEQILKRGHVLRGYLGSGFQPVVLSTKAGMESGKGLLVVSLARGGPAEAGGFLVGDVLLSVEGTSLEDPGDLQAVLDPERIGKPVEFEVLRGGQATKVRVNVGERPREA